MIAPKEPRPEEPEKISRLELQAYKRGIRQHWQIPKEMRQMIVSRLARIVEKSEDEKQVISSAKALILAVGENISLTKMDSEAETGQAIADRPKVIIMIPSNGREVPPRLEGGK